MGDHMTRKENFSKTQLNLSGNRYGSFLLFPPPRANRILTQPSAISQSHMSRKTRILIVTDSAVLPTGMAEATRLIFGALLDAYPSDYELHQVGLFHCYAVTQPRWPIYPTAACKGPDGKLRFDPNDKYGQRTAPQQIRKLKPDIVFAFGEPQRVMHLCTPLESRDHSVIAYVNFDGLPIPEGYGAQLASEKTSFPILCGSLKKSLNA